MSRIDILYISTSVNILHSDFLNVYLYLCISMCLHYLVTPLLNGNTNSPCVSPAIGGHPATSHRALLLLFIATS